MIKILILCLAVNAASLYADNTIYVYGQRQEQHQRPGHSMTLKNSEQSTKSASEWLDELGSVDLRNDLPEHSAEQPLLRLRGHDRRAAEIYLDDLKIFDPLLGMARLPVADLESLGTIEIYYGNAAIELPAITTAGGLWLRSDNLPFASYRLISEVTNQQSQKFSLYGRQSVAALTLQAYGRRARSSGRYEYFNNRGTPDNANDDLISWRSNADSRSDLLHSAVKYETLDHGLGYSLFRSLSEGGLPALGGLGATIARQESATTMQYVYWQLKTVLLQPRVFFFDQQETFFTRDSDHEFLTGAESATKEIGAQGYGLSTAWHKQLVKGIMRLETANAAAKYEHLPFRRRTDQFYLGLRSQFLASLDLEFKAKHQQLTDRLTDTAQISEFTDFSVSASRTLHKWRLWGQYAQKTSPPALVEQFGDGRYIQAASDLRHETRLHHELGLAHTAAQWSLTTAIYHDVVQDKILLLPSLPNTVKARNSGDHTINGFETAGSWQSGTVTLQAAYNFLDTLNKGSYLPYTPEHSAKLNASLRHRSQKFALTTRLQSESYRDLNNNLVIPAHAVSDFHWEQSHDLEDSFVKLHFTIVNLFNQIKMQDNKRVYPYSEQYGHPLPGRYYRLMVKLGF